MAMTPAGLPSTATKIAVAPSRAQRLGLACRAPPVSTPASAMMRAVADDESPARRPTPVTPLPTGESKSAASASVEAALAAPPRRWPRPADARCRAPGWRRAAAARSPRPRRAACTAATLGLAFGQRAGLVDDERVDLLEALQRLGVLDQHAGLRAAPDADHDRHRRGEPERAGAGDDQHRDGRDQGVGEARLRPPDDQAKKASAATAITAGTNQPATWSASRWIGARLRCACGDHLHDPRQHRVAADLLGAHDEAAGWFIVPPITLSPGSLVTGMDSPVTIDSSTALRPSSTSPSTGTCSPGRTRRRSPTATCVEGDILVAAVGADAARASSARDRAARGWRRRSARAPQLQHLAEQHQHGDDGGGLEIDRRRRRHGRARRRETAPGSSVATTL